jgi:UDP-N-acetylglucosamine--dolichyl-phosphate N-acetylglucosaminephosphotransferase
MMMFYYLLPAALSFILVLVLTPLWIAYCRRNMVCSRDRHKPGKVVPDWGGVIVLVGFLTGLMVYVVFRAASGEIDHSFFVAAVSCLLIAALIGFIDDLRSWSAGLPRYYKVLLSLLIPLPAVLFLISRTDVTIPFPMTIDIGLAYPFLLMPLIIVIAANSFNMLAGFNGLEAGAGFLILSTLSYLSWSSGNINAAMIGFCAVSAILAFLVFNWNPAMIFPGNSFTYFTGACAGLVAVLGRIEFFAAILFIPYFIEFILKLRGNFQKESFGRPLGRGNIGLPYRRFYGLEHVAIAILHKIFRKAYEWQVTVLLLVFQGLFVFVVLLLAIS